MTDATEKQRWDASWRSATGASSQFMSLENKRYVWPYEGFVVSAARLVRSGQLDLERSQVLDFGCGQGRHAVFFARSGFRQVCGVDLSHEAVEVARQWAASQNLHIDYQSYDGKVLPYNDDRFDVACCFGTFHHIPFGDQKAVADQLARVIRRGGYLLWAEMSARTTRIPPGNRVGIRTYVMDDPGDPEHGQVQHLFALEQLQGLFPQFDFQIGMVEMLEGPALEQCTSNWNLVGKKRG